MRVLHIAPLITPLGHYGGPARVAINQCRSLKELGHDVDLVAATWGEDPEPPADEAYPETLFPGMSLYPGGEFRALISPSMLPWLREHLDRYDIVHVHLARDFVTIPAAWLALRRNIPVVAQPHGMLIPTGNSLAAAFDKAITHPLLRRTSLLLYLTPLEKSTLQAAAPVTPCHRIANGVLVNEQGVVDNPSASESGAQHTVLFVGRLHPVKRPLDFVQMAAILLPNFPEAHFIMIGPDQGLGPAVDSLIERLGIGANVQWIGALQHQEVEAMLKRSALLVLPSQSEQFPMAAIEAMSAGVPVVLTPNCGISDLVRENEAGAVTELGPDALATAAGDLLGDAPLRKAWGDNARRLVSTKMSSRNVALELVDHYEDLLRQHRPARGAKGRPRILSRCRNTP